MTHPGFTKKRTRIIVATCTRNSWLQQLGLRSITPDATLPNVRHESASSENFLRSKVTGNRESREKMSKGCHTKFCNQSRFVQTNS